MTDQPRWPPSGTWHRRSTNLLNTLAVVAAAAAYLFSQLAGDTDGGRRVVLLVLGVLTAAVVVVVNLGDPAPGPAADPVRGRGRGGRAGCADHDAERRARADHELPRRDGGRPEITSTAPRSGGSSGRRSWTRRCGSPVPSARSAFYRLDPATGWLVLDVYGGRSALPRDHFVPGDEAADVLIDVVTRGDLVFIPDVEVDRLITPTSPGPVRDGDRGRGHGRADPARPAHRRRARGRAADDGRRRARARPGEPARLGSGAGAGNAQEPRSLGPPRPR